MSVSIADMEGQVSAESGMDYYLPGGMGGLVRSSILGPSRL